MNGWSNGKNNNIWFKFGHLILKPKIISAETGISFRYMHSLALSQVTVSASWLISLLVLTVLSCDILHLNKLSPTASVS